jgi:uncharacterized RDD family membrane protein YckC
MAGLGDDGFEPPDDRVVREPAPREPKVGDRLAIAEAELAHPGGTEPFGLPAGIVRELLEAFPYRGSIRDERVYVHGVTLDDRFTGDRYTIATPEGLEVDLVLAGLGSRFIARLVDSLVQLGIIIALVIVQTQLPNGWPTAALIVMLFATIFVYDILFEVFGSGRTPGKRAARLRVVRTGGRPVGFAASLIRNVLRVVDFLPTMYLGGAIVIVASRHHQRLGDLAAGTFVVRERDPRAESAGWSSWSRATVPLADVAGWDVSAVTPAEVAAMHAFIDRRLSLPPDTRARFAYELANRLGSKVSGIPAGVHPEYVIEGVLVAKEHRR